MTQDQKIIKNKLGLLKLAQALGNLSEACKVLGFRYDSFYRFKELYETGGETALAEMSPLEQQAYGQTRVSNELKKRAISVSPAGVRTIWVRRDLQTFELRLKALSSYNRKLCMS
jgi:hypothetical protein